MPKKSLLTSILPYLAALTGVHLFVSSFSTFKIGEGWNEERGLRGLQDGTTSMKRDADGCYHVFIDAGANIGVHGRFLFEPEKYPKAKHALGAFEREFGAVRDNRDFCVFEFEPNPIHQDTLNKKSDAYKAMGWRFHVMPYGVSDSAGNLTFYHQGNEKDKTHEEWGFSMVKRSDSAIAEVVDLIHFSKWLDEHVNKRRIPASTFGDYSDVKNPKVVMKLDIEGAEYSTFPDLISSGALCSTVDYMFGEFHRRRSGLDPKKEVAIETSVQTVLTESKNCKTRFELLDDEAYLHDGIPLPEPRLQTA